MKADDLHVSALSATVAAQKAITEKRCDGFRVEPRTVRNPDRTFDRGFAAIIMVQGRTVGFA